MEATRPYIVPRPDAKKSLEPIWHRPFIPLVEIPLVAAVTVSLVAPSNYTQITAGLFALAIVTSLSAFGFPRRMSSAWPVAIYMGLAVAMSFYGTQNLNPGATRVLTIPLVYLPFFAILFLCAGPRVIRGLLVGSILAGLVIGVQGALFSLHGLGVIPFQVPTLDRTQTLVEYSTTYQLTSRGLGSLAFTLPLSLFVIAFGRHLVPRRFFNLASVGVLFSLAYLLISDRRGPAAALLVAFPFALWMARRANLIGPTALLRIVLGSAALGVAVSIVLSIATGTGVGGRIQYMINATLLEAEGDGRRAYQAQRLLEEWQLKPIFGHGSGAYLPDYYSSVEFPWSYELSYVYLLFAWGMVGFLIVSALVIGSMLRAAYVTIHTNYARMSALALITGEVGMLVANATNPYLGKFDGIWIVLIPLAITNAVFISSRPGFQRDNHAERVPSARNRAEVSVSTRESAT